MTASKPKPINWKGLAKRSREAIDAAGQTPRAFRERAGLSRRTMQGILSGRAVPADAFLCLCAFLGVDPVTQAPPAGDGPAGLCPPVAIPAVKGPISWPLFATALIARAGQAHLSIKDAAAEIGVSAATLSRAGQGETMSAYTYLRMCAWLGRHPNELTVPVKTFGATADPFARAGAGRPAGARASAIADMKEARPIADRIGDRVSQGAGAPGQQAAAERDDIQRGIVAGLSGATERAG